MGDVIQFPKKTEEPGWILAKEFSEKYNIPGRTLRSWLVRHVLECKLMDAYKSGGRRRWLVLDLPPHEHPNFAQAKPVSSNHKKGTAANFVNPDVSPKVIEARKKKLREKYLPLFLEKAPPDKMVFSARDVMAMLGISSMTLYKTWANWGLRKQTMNVTDKMKKNNTKGDGYQAQVFYTRTELYRFLSGEGEEEKTGRQTLDDKFIVEAGGYVSSDGYYHYNPAAVFPLDGEGALMWIEKMGVMREDRRINGWTRFIPFSKQVEFIREAFKRKANGDYQYNLIVSCWPRGEGKSLKKGTKTITYDGRLVNIEDVKVGDLLMGPDSTPRRVLALGHGTEEMFEVTPLRGEPFVCNRSHILALKYRKEIHVRREGKRNIRRNETIDINMHLEDYMNQGPDFRSRCMLYRVPIDWPEQRVEVDPYYLGLWLSDGDRRGLQITESCDDVEIFDYLREFAKGYDCELRIARDKRSKGQSGFIVNGNSRQLRRAMAGYGLFEEKYIPHVYKANSREVRLRLLAGLLDGDGCRNRNSIQFTMKSRRLVDDIAFLARSLGFHAEIKETTKGIKSTGFKGAYYCLGISGDCSIIPNLVARKKCAPRKQVKNILYTGIKSIRSLGEGEYYGVVLDGDHLYLLENFTVTHNTMINALLAIFRFFNRFGEVINLSGNSKDQVTFAHYDLIKKIILNTPALAKTPGLVIKEKYIALLKGPNDPVCQIKAIPTSSGLLPGTTCAVFTELHKLEDRDFFIDLWTSTRATPNAMVLVDTTVASKGHIVHSLWETYCKGEDPLLFFHHYADKIYNPETTPEQLNSFKKHMLEIEYNRYFRNRWEDAVGGVFSAQSIRKIGLAGVRRAA